MLSLILISKFYSLPRICNKLPHFPPSNQRFIKQKEQLLSNLHFVNLMQYSFVLCVMIKSKTFSEYKCCLFEHIVLLLLCNTFTLTLNWLSLENNRRLSIQVTFKQQEKIQSTTYKMFLECNLIFYEEQDRAPRGLSLMVQTSGLCLIGCVGGCKVNQQISILIWVEYTITI